MSSILERIQAQKDAAEKQAAEMAQKKLAEENNASSREELARRVRDALSLSQEHLSGLLSSQLEDRKTLSDKNKKGIAAKLSETEALYTETEAVGVELNDVDKQEGRLETIKDASDSAIIEALKVKRDEIRSLKQLEKTHSYLQKNLSNLSSEEMHSLITALESEDNTALTTLETAVIERITKENTKKAEEVVVAEKENERTDLEEKIKNFPETRQKILSDILEYRKIRENKAYETEKKFELFRNLSNTFLEEFKNKESELRVLDKEIGELHETQADFIKKICNEIGRPEDFNRLRDQSFIIGDPLIETKMFLYPEWAEEIKNKKIQLELIRFPGLTEEHIKQIEGMRDKIAFLESKMTEIVFNKMIENNPQNKEKIFKIVDRENKKVAEMKRLNEAVRENNRIAKILNERDGGSRSTIALSYDLQNTVYPINYDSEFGGHGTIQTLRYNTIGSFIYY